MKGLSRLYRDCNPRSIYILNDGDGSITLPIEFVPPPGMYMWHRILRSSCIKLASIVYVVVGSLRMSMEEFIVAEFIVADCR